MTNPLFYAKILLFGEYGIIEDSQGLTLPYSFYKGTLKFSSLDSEFEKKSNEHLKKYAEYLENLKLPETFSLSFQTFFAACTKAPYSEIEMSCPSTSAKIVPLDLNSYTRYCAPT